MLHFSVKWNPFVCNANKGSFFLTAAIKVCFLFCKQFESMHPCQPLSERKTPSQIELDVTSVQSLMSHTLTHQQTHTRRKLNCFKNSFVHYLLGHLATVRLRLAAGGDRLWMERLDCLKFWFQTQRTLLRIVRGRGSGTLVFCSHKIHKYRVWWH